MSSEFRTFVVKTIIYASAFYFSLTEQTGSSIIYQLSDIGMDDQILEGEIQSVIYQTHYFAPNILHDDYVIHFLAFRLERFDCSNIP